MTDAKAALQGGFHHLALRVENFEATIKFYREGLGLTPVLCWGEGDGRAAMLEVGNGNFLEIFAGGSAAAKPEGALLHFALRATDVEGALECALQAGATLQMAPTTITVAASPHPADVHIAFCIGPGRDYRVFPERGVVRSTLQAASKAFFRLPTVSVPGKGAAAGGASQRAGSGAAGMSS